MYIKKKGSILVYSLIIIFLITFVGSITFKVISLRGKLETSFSECGNLYELDKEYIEKMKLVNKRFSSDELKKLIFSETEKKEIKKGLLTLSYLKKENKLKLNDNYFFRFSFESPCTCKEESCILEKEEKVIILPEREAFYE